MKRLANGIWQISDEEMNTIICDLMQAEDHYIERGYPLVADGVREKMSKLYDELDAAGYYDDVKRARRF